MTLFEIKLSLRHTATPRIDRAIWPLTTYVDEQCGLCVGEIALTDVAESCHDHSTPISGTIGMGGAPSGLSGFG
jgi:hypothetical protein